MIHEFGEDGESDHDSTIKDTPQQYMVYQHTQVRKPRSTSRKCHDEPSSHPFSRSKPPERDTETKTWVAHVQSHEFTSNPLLHPQKPSISARGLVQGENREISFELSPRTRGDMNRRKPTERLVFFGRERHFTKVSSCFSLYPACDRDGEGGSARV
jgi:hypothetical protein